MQRIHIEHDARANAAVLTGEGELDAFTAPLIERSLAEAGLDGRPNLVVDLERVSFLDSTALGLLVRAVRDVREGGGEARVVLPETTARRIFEITTLDRVLPIAASRSHALDELAGRERPDE